jgi:hypothetical protein
MHVPSKFLVPKRLEEEAFRMGMGCLYIFTPITEKKTNYCVSEVVVKIEKKQLNITHPVVRCIAKQNEQLCLTRNPTVSNLPQS